MDSNGKELPESLFQISNSVVEDVFYNGQSRFIEGAQSDVTLESSKSILRLDLQTILCSPLITDGNKIGVIYVDSKHLHKIKEKETTSTCLLYTSGMLIQMGFQTFIDTTCRPQKLFQ